MKKNAWLAISLLATTLLLLNFTPPTASTERGKVLESQSFYSKILSKNVKYSVYLPPNYDHDQRSYPTVYLLHGYTDNETAWVQFGEVQNVADALINAGDLPPMVIVMPDAGVSWYVNSYDDSLRYENMFFEELIPYMEKTYYLRTQREFRGVAGLSMGGFGTMLYALKHPDKFIAAAPLSAAVFTEEDILNFPDDRWNNVVGQPFGKNLKGNDRLTDHLKANNPQHILQNIERDKAAQVSFFIDCGDDDFLSAANATLHIALKKKNIPHEYRMRDGEHNWTYWRTGIGDALQFIGERFHR